MSSPGVDRLFDDLRRQYAGAGTPISNLSQMLWGISILGPDYMANYFRSLNNGQETLSPTYLSCDNFATESDCRDYNHLR